MQYLYTFSYTCWLVVVNASPSITYHKKLQLPYLKRPLITVLDSLSTDNVLQTIKLIMVLFSSLFLP